MSSAQAGYCRRLSVAAESVLRRMKLTASTNNDDPLRHDGGSWGEDRDVKGKDGRIAAGEKGAESGVFVRHDDDGSTHSARPQTRRGIAIASVAAKCASPGRAPYARACSESKAGCLYAAGGEPRLCPDAPTAL